MDAILRQKETILLDTRNEDRISILLARPQSIRDPPDLLLENLIVI
jgi:hypothetical protein